MATPSKKLVCLITGANQGLGFEAAKALATHSHGPNGETYHVLVGSRDLAKGQKAAAVITAAASPSKPLLGSVEAIQLDVTDAASIAAAAAKLEKDHGCLDALVNNAGTLSQDPAGVAAALRADLEVNVLGAAAVTEAFLPLLLRPAAADPRLVFVSSSMGSLAGAADPSSRYYRSVLGTSPLEYRVSKAALNMLMLEYWKRYGAEPRVAVGGVGVDTKVRVWSADPGANATDFMGEGRAELARRNGIQGPEVGAQVLVGCVVGERDGEEGKVVGAYGVGPW
ncbi:NAD(P)-binding protein [Diaporthe amygdali]|uniref:NAD(P)-binding protein n=1 Tax=Phomopsis amygdali TaxID=1214568 RepID=UPI0022FE45E1|nr:NAD(P)-binding protein [Diaporthe amygdali]KAJ0116927.1 NAD(P)-binding protein [Diaporthe amygdali]